MKKVRKKDEDQKKDEESAKYKVQLEKDEEKVKKYIQK